MIGENAGAGHAFTIWRYRQRFPAGVSVRSDIRYIAAAVLRNYRILETCLVVGILQLRGYKARKTGAASPLKLPEQVDDDVLTINVAKFSSMQGVYGNLAERVFNIDTT